MSTTENYALRVHDMSKRFATSGPPALDHVSVDLKGGEIHGLLGQNGSGKSTLIKILTGIHAPESGGRLEVRGEAVSLPIVPGRYQEHGIAVVHQNLGLVGGMSVLDNLSVKRYVTTGSGQIKWRQQRERARRALARFDLSLDLDALVEDLPEATRAMIAIARALAELEDAGEAGALILDEPTPYLSRDAVSVLFEAMRNAAKLGHGILFVSHRIDEVQAITDRITVLRNGRNSGTVKTADCDSDQIIEMIVGQRLRDLYPDTHQSMGKPVLRARGLGGVLVNDCEFTAHEGEILGLTGLAGMGFEEIPYLMVGESPDARGTLEIDGREFPLPETSLPVRLAAGLALVPADRERLGAALGLTVRENVTLPRIREFFHSGRIDYKAERESTERLIEDFDIRPADQDRNLGTLSGGNQQKALLGKWLMTKPRVLALHEPTQGVDIGARKAIFSSLREAADQGSAIIVASIEYEDLAHICNRILVFRDGQIVAELRGSGLSKEAVIEECLQVAPQ